VKTKIDSDASIATLILNRPPVNSLSLEMCEAISCALKEIEKGYPDVHGLVLASSSPSTLSAGLDFQELHKPDPERLPEFWSSFQQLFIDLYGSRLACIAALEGHAFAGGCMLAMSCDYRVMSTPNTGKGLIGLNETKFGIVAPSWMADLMVRTVGYREAEKALSLGHSYDADEAIGVGLVDEIVPKDQVLDRSKAVAAKWARIPPHARFASKKLMRRNLIDKLKANRKQDIDTFCSFVQNDLVQNNISIYLENLKKKAKK